MKLHQLRKKVDNYSHDQLVNLEEKLFGTNQVSDNLITYVAVSAYNGLSYDTLAGRLGLSIAFMNKLITESRLLFDAYVMGAQLYISDLEYKSSRYLVSNIGESTRVKLIDQLYKLSSKAKADLNNLVAKYENGELQGSTEVSTGRGGKFQLDDF
jgi:hypothetical protein